MISNRDRSISHRAPNLDHRRRRTASGFGSDVALVLGSIRRVFHARDHRGEARSIKEPIQEGNGQRSLLSLFFSSVLVIADVLVAQPTLKLHAIHECCIVIQASTACFPHAHC